MLALFVWRVTIIYIIKKFFPENETVYETITEYQTVIECLENGTDPEVEVVESRQVKITMEKCVQSPMTYKYWYKTPRFVPLLNDQHGGMCIPDQVIGVGNQGTEAQGFRVTQRPHDLDAEPWHTLRNPF